MKVRARLIDHNRLVFLRFTGSQTADMAVNELRNMRQLPNYTVGLPELADLSGITDYNLDYTGMRRLAREANVEGASTGLIKKIAIFAPQDALYGMARMFSTLSEMEPGNAQGAAFQTQEEALKWLGRSETRFEEIPGYDLVPVD